MKKISLTKILGLITMVACTVGALAGLFDANWLRSLKCLFGTFIVAFPLFIKPRLFSWLKPYVMNLFIIFIFFAFFFGEFLSFYSFTHFDSFLHIMSGGLIAAAGFEIFAAVDQQKKMPLFMYALFAFCFAMTIGAFWEMYEFTGDRLLNLNMQRFAGHEGWHALYDTMKDIFCNTAGALTVSLGLWLKTFNKPTIPLKK